MTSSGTSRAPRAHSDYRSVVESDVHQFRSRIRWPTVPLQQAPHLCDVQPGANCRSVMRG